MNLDKKQAKLFGLFTLIAPVAVVFYAMGTPDVPDACWPETDPFLDWFAGMLTIFCFGFTATIGFWLLTDKQIDPK